MSVTVRVLSSPDAELRGRSFFFEGYSSFLFGRSADAHCRSLQDPYVSRNHFLLEIDPPRVLLKDLGSRNGTQVLRGDAAEPGPGKVHPGAWAELSDGDRILVGKTEFSIAVQAPAPAAPPAEASGPGPVRGRCEIVDLLCEGGMGSVYHMRDKETRQDLAMKVLRPGAADGNPAARALFLREIAIWKGLDHPNIIRFVEDGRHEGAAYVLMEFARGGSAADLLAARGGRLRLGEAAPILLQSLAGLAHLHGQGFVHRDMKPGNILLDARDGRRIAKIGDFGLARNFEQAGSMQSRISLPGLAMGSAGYMPKEQLIDFKFVKPPGDVFSAGGAFYHMLTGEFPYRREPEEDPLGAILDGNIIPIAERLPDLPKSLAAVIDKALRPEPADRYPDAAAMLTDMEAALSDSSPSGPKGATLRS